MGCKTCIPNKTEIKIVTVNKKSTEINTELDLIDKIIEKRNQTINIQTVLTLDAKQSEDEIKNSFFEDINNEKKLCSYLDKLQKTSKDEFERILFLYFNSLSPENKKKYTTLIFHSNIDVFLELIKSINERKFNQFNYLSDIDVRKMLIENNIVKIYPNLLEMIEKEKQPNNSNITKKLKLEIESILNNRIKSKITLSNPELYFDELIKIYVEKFSESIDDNVYKIASFNLFYTYENFIDCIDKIKNNKNHVFSPDEENYFLLIFFAPIFGDDVQKMSDFNNNDLNNNDNDFNFIVSGKKLLVEDSNNKQILQFPDNDAVNKKIIIEEFKKYVHYNVEINEYLIINCVKPKYFQQYNFYKINKKIWEFNSNLLKHIFKSKTLKTVLHYLRPELKNLEIFEDDKIVKEIFESIIFVPYEIINAYGASSKSFLKIFINGLSPKYIGKVTILNSSSSFQIVNIHEVSENWICGYISYKLKNNLLYDSVCYKNYKITEYNEKIKEFDLEQSDGGEIIEKILFSRVMEYTTIREMLFILCKKSYDDDYLAFKQKFKEVKNLGVEKLYKEVIQDIDLYNYLNFLGIDLKYLKAIEKTEINLKYKRNGEIKRSKCRTKLISL